jgi:hypothetical protein
MANLYADQVAGVQDKIQNIQLNQIETYNDMADNITSKYNSKLAQYESKWKSVQEGGGEDFAAIIGAKGIYGSGKAVYDLYKKAKNKGKGKDDSKDGDDEEEPKGFDNEEEQFHGFGDDEPADVPGTLTPDIPASSLSSTGGGAVPGADLSGTVRIPSANALGKRRAKIQGDDEDEPGPAEPDLGGPAPGPLTDATPSNTNLATGRQELDTSGGEFEDFSNSLQTGGRTLSSTISTTVRGAASEGEEAVQGFASKLYNKFGQSGRDMIAKGKSFFSKSAGDTDATAAEGAEEGTSTVVASAAAEGGEAAAFGTTEAVLGGIPVVGEIALAVGGLVAIGDSIYHLFHHPKEAPAIPVATPVNIPQTLTAKFSSALPSVDNSTDRSSSMSSF